MRFYFFVKKKKKELGSELKTLAGRIDIEWPYRRNCY
jgi:hypothetical protein